MKDQEKTCPTCKRRTRYIAPNALRCGHCLDEIALDRSRRGLPPLVSPRDVRWFLEVTRGQS